MDHYMQMAYEWPADKSCAVVVSADVDGESPFIWNQRGQPVNTLSELEQRRFGPRVGVYRLMNLLDEFSAKGSFFVPGFVAEQYPHLLPELVERGHEVGLHGYYHERVDQLSDGANVAVLDKSIAIFEQQLGFIPKGYRSPAWEMTPVMFQLLKQRDLAYDSSLMSFDHPYSVEGLTELPVQWLLDDEIYFCYTGAQRHPCHPAAPAVVLDSWIEEFEGIREYGGLFMITVHPWLTGRPQRLRMLRKLFQHIVRYDDVWWTTAQEVAGYHAASENNAIFDIQAQLVDAAIDIANHSE